MKPLPRHIQTRRLTLRLPEDGDGLFWDELAALEEVRVSVRLASLAKTIQRWRDNRDALYVACLRTTGAPIGVAGFAAPFRKEGPHLLCAIAREQRGLREGSATFAREACVDLVQAWHRATGTSVFAHIERDPSSPGKRDGRVEFATSLGAVPVGVTDDWDSEKFFDFEFPVGARRT